MRSRKLSLCVASVRYGLRQGQDQDLFTQIPQELYLPREVLTKQYLCQGLECAMSTLLLWVELCFPLAFQ